MYLKSLVLKGFKSFADRSVLSLEPGISAVVGPNGSGKSNISDAVLWVLGERNAKNLRGQVMEDVIFAGSSARKSVRVAEVELVLDNSDGQLPVDYSEVSIARRMYRSGESEYLINGSLARRMDVLDILHDSGLGTGTHSIISQGHLDSILQSRPEDRRALIEEAAGVLKHKQRKAKSARKIEQMDSTLARVGDVVGEVARQLGPLQRKAKRALAHKEASEELADVSLKLAVDDLRTLKRSWGEVLAREKAQSESCEQGRAAVEAAERTLEELQAAIRQESDDAAQLSRVRQRAATVAERLESCTLLISEKKGAAERRDAELGAQIEANAAKRAEAARAEADAAAKAEEAAHGLSDAQERVEKLFREHAKAVEERARLERDVFARRGERRDREREADRVRDDLAKTREKLTSNRGKAELLAERAEEVAASLAEARDAAEAAGAELAQAESAIKTAQAAETAARAAFEEAGSARDAARAARDDATGAVRTLEAQIAGLEEVERAAAQAAGAATAWMTAHPEAAGGAGASPIAGALDVEAGYEAVVETILGADATAFSVADGPGALRAARAVAEARAEGEVAFALCDADRDAVAEASRAAAAACGGYALIDKVHAAHGLEGAAAALLADVVVCPTEEAALEGRADDTHGLRFCTTGGFSVWPSGKVVAGSPVAANGEGAIARARRLAQAREELGRAQEAKRKAEEAYPAAESAAAQAREALLAAQQDLSRVKGARAAAESAKRAADKRAASLQSEHDSMAERREKTAAAIAELEPAEARLASDLADAEVACGEAQSALGRAQAAVAPARDEEARLERSLSEAKLSEAKLKERATFAKSSLETARRQIVAADEAGASARADRGRHRVIARRAQPLLAALSAIGRAAHARAAQLEATEKAAFEAASGTHGKADDARAKAKEAHVALDEANERLSQVRIEKSRLEMQVEAAVSVIVQDCATPLETALELPEIEDRATLEQDAFRLKKRIQSLGRINPDAADEYEALKRRYDYLAGQLADLNSARASLAKIDRVIDERMKLDFERTFEQVNANFQDIFSTLFPGGSAELSLTDPDDIENSGVEVSAQPRGKRIAKMSLMSGGEKSLVAIALLFAAYRIRHAPFYILDEVEAALDDTNLRRLTNYLASLRNDTQLIMITHQRRTMEMADVLFGVSMQADGVTKVISQRLEKALQYAE